MPIRSRQLEKNWFYRSYETRTWEDIVMWVGVAIIFALSIFMIVITVIGAMEYHDSGLRGSSILTRGMSGCFVASTSLSILESNFSICSDNILLLDFIEMIEHIFITAMTMVMATKVHVAHVIAPSHLFMTVLSISLAVQTG